jgi:hypothetical protein
MQCIRRDRLAMRSTGWRHAVDASAPRAATIWASTAGRTASACPADQVEALEGLAGGDGGEQSALGCLAMAYRCPAP